MNTIPLTLSNLCFPDFQVQIKGRTESFVRSQRAYAPAFAAEGRRALDDSQPRFVNSNVPVHHSDISPSRAMQGIGFSSPVLEARMDRTQRGTLVTMLDITEDGLDDHKAQMDGTGRSRGGRQLTPLRACVSKDKTTKKTHVPRPKRRAGSLDSDQAARLTERRDRKRTKRAIMNPEPLASDGESPSEAGQGSGKAQHKRTTKVKKKKKAKIDAELTLMQSFSATNIGKGRLTLKPGPSMGVFNKGKASVPTKTTLKRKSKKDITFSETKFLKARGSSSMRSWAVASPSSSSTSDAGNKRKSKISKFFSTDHSPKCGNASSKHLQTQSDEGGRSPGKPTVPQKEDRSDIQEDLLNDGRESEVWDIELGKALPSSDGNEGDQGEKDDVVLNTRAQRWGPAGLTGNTREHQMLEKQENVQCRPNSSPTPMPPVIPQQVTSSPSIAPSNSVSQRITAEPRLSEHDMCLAEPTRNQTSMVHSIGGSRETYLTRTKPTSFRFRPAKQYYSTVCSSFKIPDPGCMILAPYIVDGPSQMAYQAQLEILGACLEAEEEPILYEAEGQQIDRQDFDCPDSQYRGVTLDGYSECYEGHEDLQWENVDFDQSIDSGDEDGEILGSVTGFFADDENHAPEEWFDEPESELQETMEGYISAPDGSRRQQVADVITNNLADCGPEWLSESDPSAGYPVASLTPRRTESQLYDLASESRFPFSQGRSLLLGVELPIVQDGNGQLEAGLCYVDDVTLHLKDHWLPQKL